MKTSYVLFLVSFGFFRFLPFPTRSDSVEKVYKAHVHLGGPQLRPGSLPNTKFFRVRSSRARRVLDAKRSPKEEKDSEERSTRRERTFAYLRLC